MTRVTGDNFSGVLEMMILKLDYAFAPLVLFFLLREVELEISFSIYSIRHTCWINSSSFKGKNTENEKKSFG